MEPLAIISTIIGVGLGITTIVTGLLNYRKTKEKASKLQESCTDYEIQISETLTFLRELIEDHRRNRNNRMDDVKRLEFELAREREIEKRQTNRAQPTSNANQNSKAQAVLSGKRIEGYEKELKTANEEIRHLSDLLDPLQKVADRLLRKNEMLYFEDLTDTQTQAPKKEETIKRKIILRDSFVRKIDSHVATICNPETTQAARSDYVQAFNILYDTGNFSDDEFLYIYISWLFVVQDRYAPRITNRKVAEYLKALPFSVFEQFHIRLSELQIRFGHSTLLEFLRANPPVPPKPTSSNRESSLNSVDTQRSG